MANPAFDFEDDTRYELINGETVAMAPANINHSAVVSELHRVIANYFDDKPCRVFVDSAGVFLSEKDHFAPDIFVVCRPEIIETDAVYGAPDLVVEVLSRSTTHRDRGYKKNIYGKHGVREYWLISPAEKSVEVYLQKNGVLELENVHFTPDSFSPAIFPGLTVNLLNVFKWIV